MDNVSIGTAVMTAVRLILIVVLTAASYVGTAGDMKIALLLAIVYIVVQQIIVGISITQGE